MPTFDIVRNAQPEETFRVASIIGKFDLESSNIKEQFTGNINLPDEWQIGLIVGNSGTGKTTIAKELFPNNYITKYEYTHETILDDMPEQCTVEQISKAFNSVGFSSPPSWLKSYDMLSNGQKMRVDLARAMLEEQPMFVFDEFTSVVDRNVAQIGSYAIQKAIRRTNKQFIAVTCHEDVEEWLQPDWTFTTDTMTFNMNQKKNRPDITFEIYRVKDKSIWRTFAKHHYLNHSHNNAATVFIALVNGQIAGFYSVLPFPHPKKKNTYRAHRFVILPDYQGAGIGMLMQNAIAKHYDETLNKTFIITTSHPAIVHALKADPNWRLTRYGRTPPGSKKAIVNKQLSNRITAAFQYIRKKQKS